MDEIGRLTFSPDSKHLACVVKKGNKWMVEVDGQAGPELDRPSQGEMYIKPVFSADSKRLAYWAMNGRKYVTVVDGKPLDAEAQFPAFSPDSQHTAYVQRTAVFSADSKHVASFARNGDPFFEPDTAESFAVVDGQQGPKYDQIPLDYESVPLFNADGTITYLAVKGNVAYAVTQFPPQK